MCNVLYVCKVNEMPKRTTNRQTAEQATNEKEKVTTMGFVIDMTGVSTNQVVEPGKYHANFTKAELRDSANGNKRISAMFTIDDPYQTEMNGKKIFTNYTLVPESLPFLKRDLIALGVDEDEIQGKFDVMEKFASLAGTKVMADVKVQTNPQNKQLVNRTQIYPLDSFA